VNYVEYNPATLNTNAPHEGGFVSFWFRPDEGFFSSTDRTLVKIVGEAAEDISLVVSGPLTARILKMKINAKKHVYEDQGRLADTNHKPADPAAPDVTYKGDIPDYIDASYSDITKWQPGEWHHVAMAWHECINDQEDHNLEIGYNSDGNVGTKWQDDDQGGTGGKPDYELDDEVASFVRLWVDGNSSAVTDAANKRKAFNLYAPVAPAGAIRLGGEAMGTIDGLIAMSHTDKALAPGSFPNVTLPQLARYDGVDAAAPANAKYAEYESAPISIPNAGGDTITLGTITWNGMLPWMNEADRWGGPAAGTASTRFGARRSRRHLEHRNPGERQGLPQVLRRAAHLQRRAAPQRLDAHLKHHGGTALKYRIFLLPRQGTVRGTPEGNDHPGLLEGRQTPIVESVTVTYLGPVVFFYWQ